MMVGTYRQHLACVAAQLNGVKRHRSMKPSSRDPQLGLASPLNYAANKSGKIKIKSPSKKEAGAGCKSPALASREGTGETFFLDILFHRMSEIAYFVNRQKIESLQVLNAIYSVFYSGRRGALRQKNPS
jgi:hypothetical protein